MEPLVKWYGGLDSNKTELIRSMIPGRFDHYYEPFLGGGALYFSMEGSTCYVNEMLLSHPLPHSPLRR